MRSLEAIERELEIVPPTQTRREAARWLLGLAEEVLEAWVGARGEEPTDQLREGFRLLALHHQGARAVPSFNACRETCREIVYHHNLLVLEGPEEAEQRLAMMLMLVRHLALFVGGKLQVEGLGDFCCASRPVRQNDANIAKESPPA